MKIVYIAGPYSGDGKDAIERNIREAEAFAIELARRHIGFFCPHLNSAHFQTKTDAPADFWYAMDLSILDRCDAIALSPRWRESKGCRREVDLAMNLGMPILTWVNLDAWGPDYAWKS